MGSAHTIDENRIGYNMLRHFITRKTYRLFYKKFKIVNDNIIPNDRPVILASNHQNALMDALAISIFIKQQTVFLARADIFKNPLIIKFLTFIKIKPIYRMRDGVENLQKNEEIFESTVDILRRKINPLSLYPEGNHAGFRKLRPLTKGIFRIAFRAQEDYKDKPGVIIIPLGLDYSEYQKIGSDLFVNFGKPIEVCEYWKDYEENPPVAINKLRDRLSEEMKKYMIHIETTEYYDLYMALRSIYTPVLRKKIGLKKDKLQNRFVADKVLIDILDKTLNHNSQTIEDLNIEYKNYSKIRDRLNFRDWVFRKGKFSILLTLFGLLLSLVTLPISLLGLFNHWPHFFITPKFANKIKDPQFRSTAKWAIGTVIYYLYFLILAVLALIFIPFWWVKVAYLLTMTLSGVFALKYRNYVIKSLAAIRYKYLLLKKDPRLISGIESFKKIDKILNSITTGTH